MLRDDQYQLTDSIELDEGFFETINKNLSKDEINKRGRGSQKQTMALVMIQSKENKENKNNNRPDKKWYSVSER